MKKKRHYAMDMTTTAKVSKPFLNRFVVMCVTIIPYMIFGEKKMPDLRCSCGRRYEYDVVSGRFREVIDAGDVVLKIRCSNHTREIFKQLKKEKDMPSYEALLQLLMSVSNL